MEETAFNFKDFGLREASVVLNGVHEPSESYKLDITSGDKADLYASFLENTGVPTDDREFRISMTDYYGGNLLLVSDRLSNKCNRFLRHEMDSGSIDVNLKIREPLPNTVTVIIYATYSTDIHIDIDNKVFILRFLKPYKKWHIQVPAFQMLQVINAGNFALLSLKMWGAKYHIVNL